MQGHHWFGLVVVALLAYYIGTKYPGLAQSVGL